MTVSRKKVKEMTGLNQRSGLQANFADGNGEHHADEFMAKLCFCGQSVLHKIN